MAEVQWWYARDDEQLGPLTPADLRRLASGGGLAPTDLVWREGMSEWAPAARIKGLFPETRDPADDAPPQASPPAEPGSALAPPVEQGRAQTPEAIFPSDSSGGEMFAGELPTVAPSPAAAIESGLFRTTAAPEEASFPPQEPVPVPTSSSRIPFVLLLAQGVLWGTCGLVVLLGGLLFSVSRLRGTSPSEEAASATVLGMFFIGAYVVAQAGEKISRLVLSFLERRRGG
jgi:hypothetical protein